MANILHAVIPLLAVITFIVAYPVGIPMIPPACNSMYPYGHYADAQNSTPPYEIVVSPKTYTPGSVVTVTLRQKAGAPPEQAPMGILVQARVANCNMAHSNYDKAMGSFGIANDNKMEYYGIRCNWENYGGCGDTVVHQNGDPKGGVLTLMWNAPGDYIGDVYIRATFVQSQIVFWMNVYSDFIVQDPANQTTTAPEICTPVMKMAYFSPQQ